MGRVIIVILIMLVATMPSFAQSSPELIQVFIMRHAEKADDGNIFLPAVANDEHRNKPRGKRTGDQRENE